MSEEKPFYDWKKNLDSNFLNGEDLKFSRNGLKPEMVVVIEKINDAESFDQNKQQKSKVTTLTLKEVGGQELYKPIVLNKVNGKMLEKIYPTTNANAYEWIGKPFI